MGLSGTVQRIDTVTVYLRTMQESILIGFFPPRITASLQYLYRFEPHSLGPGLCRFSETQEQRERGVVLTPLGAPGGSFLAGGAGREA